MPQQPYFQRGYFRAYAVKMAVKLTLIRCFFEFRSGFLSWAKRVMLMWLLVKRHAALLMCDIYINNSRGYV